MPLQGCNPSGNITLKMRHCAICLDAHGDPAHEARHQISPRWLGGEGNCGQGHKQEPAILYYDASRSIAMIKRHASTDKSSSWRHGFRKIAQYCFTDLLYRGYLLFSESTAICQCQGVYFQATFSACT